jgi:hypothetical protein
MAVNEQSIASELLAVQNKVVRNIHETLTAGNMVNVSTAGHWLNKQVVCEVQKWLSDTE